MCVVQGVGYPNPSQSHFRSMDIWHAGQHRRDADRGLARQGAQGEAGCRRSTSPAATRPSPLALDRRAGARAVDRVARRLPAEDRPRPAAPTRRPQKGVIDGRRRTRRAAGKPDLLDFVARTPMNTYASSEQARGDRQELHSRRCRTRRPALGQPAEARGPAHRRRHRRAHLLRLDRRLRHARRPGRRGRRAREPAAASVGRRSRRSTATSPAAGTRTGCA